jgi:dipeptide/tripeptide permease
MAKNPRHQQNQLSIAKAVEDKPTDSISHRGKKVIGIGIGVVAHGFWILTYTDPAGQNWASTVSPLLLVLGYGMIGVGIVLPDPSDPSLPIQNRPPSI